MIRTPRPSIYHDRLEEVSKELVGDALAESEGNIQRAAKYLGISRAGLYKLLRRHGIIPPKGIAT